MNPIRGFVEGLGSKTLAFLVAGIVAAIVAPILFTKFGISPELTFDVLCGIAVAVGAGVFNRWHLDTKSGGQTTTAYLLTQKALQGVAAVAPDHTFADKLAKQLLEAMQKAAAEPPSSSGPVAPAALPAPVPVPPAPPSP